ncbi:aryl-alcohol-oxidase from pleurotus Eryingii [Rhizodiscina lignyota]|uniref:Aryl-alcohol-oxidase from pleurotus Eryingii n=1 Tax=Rhizodiscina lignyota TaxID=1504668 RepID=A0A9P4IF31_9PEZI|nr:aryl-alcohol-oxidase from pleurotus Eryingii [Rhizodiscina lignyota]
MAYSSPYLYFVILYVLVYYVNAFNLYTSPADVGNKSYDFVIVGGGTAGCVLAARLTEDPGVRVLVVEAGGDNHDPDALNTTIPFLAPTLANSAVTWNFTTTPQQELQNRSVAFERGHVLGGSSSVNVLAYQRGSDEVYDRWARVVEDDGWAWKNVRRYYLRNSRIVPPADGHSITGQFIPSAHGNGPVQVSFDNRHDVSNDFVLGAAKMATDTHKFRLDLNAGNFTGTSFLQSSIGSGIRSSSATAYLDPLRIGRENLDVLIGTRATKLISSKTKGKSPSIEGVELGQTKGSACVSVMTKKEVILSAGVIGTPMILQLSGIGPAAQLKQLGISTLVDIPDVGSNLMDQPFAALYWFVNSSQTWDEYLRNTTIEAEDLEEWKTKHQGLLAGASAGSVSYVRLPSNASIFKTVPDPSAGLESAHVEMLYTNGFSRLGLIPFPDKGNFMTVEHVVVSPTSRGSVRLNSSDPFAAPIIDPNYLSSEFDRFAMMAGIRSTFDFLKLPAFKGFIGEPLVDLQLDSGSDATLLGYIRNNTVTVNHGCGTARMSPVGADWGVLDPNLKVKKVNGLRVVDASSIVLIPETHIQAPTYIIAEKAADMIKSDYRLR